MEAKLVTKAIYREGAEEVQHAKLQKKSLTS